MIIRSSIALVVSAALMPAVPDAAAQDAGDADTVVRALVDELDRSMTLQLEDLERPYFVQYAVSDASAHSINASCGAIVSSDDIKRRILDTEVRVGYYDLDNTNFMGGAGGARGFARRGRRGTRGGGLTMLPIDDDYLAIRQAAWLSTDGAYKSAAETLTRKRAYMEDKSFPDRPDDFSRQDAVELIEPRVELALDVASWEARLRELSARLLAHSHLQDHGVSLSAAASNDYLVNSEGTRMRTGTERVVLSVIAEVQAEDGELIRDRLTYNAAVADELPPVEEIIEDIDEMATQLAAKGGAPVLDDYTGPILFDGVAAPQVFDAMLGRGVAGSVDPVGAGRRRFDDMTNLEKYLGRRILPRSFRVHDDPTVERVGDTVLAGHYLHDDEGVAAQRIDIVVDGKLQTMAMSRVPTTELSGSNGHGRRIGGGARASIGCLFVESGDAVPEDELRAALLEAAADEDLEFAIRVSSLGRRGGAAGQGAGTTLGDPIAIFKVFPDGREQLVRGAGFGELDVGDLKDILAAGQSPTVYNRGAAGGAPASITAPAVLFEEVDLFTIEEERPKKPVLEAPHRRDGDQGERESG